ncbi:MAG: ribosomal RNA small subunit methyltransferase A [Candidatus Micrarchaeota archaeon]|nr:ribosomal RNA small subunit methyltransferase A [Candidatus Micrarchaeota archaeon]
MESQYIATIRNLGPIRRLGQNFLLDRSVAQAEAAHAEGKVVLEVGPGLGILTDELCRTAKKVIAVEKDRRLFEMLEANSECRNLELINSDFFKADQGMISGADIMISNIPYSISSPLLEWLYDKGMQAVLCLQKEFVERMLAQPGSSEYSKLSVMTALRCSVTYIMDVPRGSFYPVPKVDSAVVYLKPKEVNGTREDWRVIGLLMEHKKKTLRNALVDSRGALGLTKGKARELAEDLGSLSEFRCFKLGPKELLSAAKSIAPKIIK